MQNELKIAAIQASLFWENSQSNLQSFQNKIETLDTDVDLIVLPEMFSTGFTMQPNLVAETMEGTTVSWMKGIAIKNIIHASENKEDAETEIALWFSIDELHSYKRNDDEHTL